MDDVLAHAERRRGGRLTAVLAGGGLSALRSRAPAPAAGRRSTAERGPAVGGARAGPGAGPGVKRRRLHAVEQLRRDLVEEAARQPVALRAEHRAAPRVGQVQLLHRARHADVEQAPLLLERAFVERARVGEDPVLAAGDEHDRILQPLRVVQRHQGHEPLVLGPGVGVGDERDLLQEDFERVLALRRARVELAPDLYELLEVLDPALRLDRPLGLERVDIARL